MAKKLITADEILKIKGYNMAALNGTEILGIIGDYYLKHELSDVLHIDAIRFVEYKGTPKCGYIDLTSIESAVQVRKDFPKLFVSENAMFGCREYFGLRYGWLYFLVYKLEFDLFTEGRMGKKEIDEIKSSFIPTIIIDEASEDVVIKFIKSIGGYKIEKIRGKHKYILRIV